MKKCVCGHDTFKEYSREDCCQLGVRINDDGSHDYDDAGTIEPCGNGVEILYLECEKCGKKYSDIETAEDIPSDEERLFEFSVVLGGHGRTPAEAWQNAKDATDLFAWKDVPEHKAVRGKLS